MWLFFFPPATSGRRSLKVGLMSWDVTYLKYLCDEALLISLHWLIKGSSALLFNHYLYLYFYEHSVDIISHHLSFFLHYISGH